MNEFEVGGVMVLLFALRCVVPAVLMFGLGYLMNWLVDRWQKEDVACQKAQKQYCLAYTQHGDRCWSARLTAEGTLPAECVNCPIYVKAIRIA